MTDTRSEALVNAIASAAESWRDPDYEGREAAVESTLAADNAFTEEAVAFAVNQQMSQLTAENMRAWTAGRRSTAPLTVGVLNPGNIPFVGLQDFLAVVLTGHRYLGSISSKSPALLPRFCQDVRHREPSLDASFVETRVLFDQADAILATGSDDTIAWVRAECRSHAIPEEMQIVRGHRFSVAVLDGTESDDAYERLAEDALLHEGFGCRNVAVIWAPAGSAPDALLDAFARFRSVFPAHRNTPGRLRMQRAFLEAVEAPHAYGEGLEFLLSKGDPEPQEPGHVRWTEYRDLVDVESWLNEHITGIQLVVAPASISDRLRTALPVEPPGDAQRPSLSWYPDGLDTIDALVSLR